MFGARFAVFVRRARVLPIPCPATRNLSFLEVSPAPSPCCFNLLFNWDSTGWCENSIRWKSYKPVWTRRYGAQACLAHGLQCLCDGRACYPARAMQLVILLYHDQVIESLSRPPLQIHRRYCTCMYQFKTNNPPTHKTIDCKHDLSVVYIASPCCSTPTALQQFNFAICVVIHRRRPGTKESSSNAKQPL